MENQLFLECKFSFVLWKQSQQACKILADGDCFLKEKLAIDLNSPIFQTKVNQTFILDTMINTISISFQFRKKMRDQITTKLKEKNVSEEDISSSKLVMELTSFEISNSKSIVLSSLNV